MQFVTGINSKEHNEYLLASNTCEMMQESKKMNKTALKEFTVQWEDIPHADKEW